jgi:hypothetical protein
MGILPRAFVFVPIRPAASVNLLALSVATAFAAAPNAGVASPREAYRPYAFAARIANFRDVRAVLREEFVTLLSGEQHG